MTSLKAEFKLCRKNRANFILGAVVLFIYCLLLLFSGVGGATYAAMISLIGFVTIMLFLIPWFMSPASMFQNRKKVCISSEHMAQMLGISKRTFVKNRIIVCLIHWGLMCCIISVLQIPAGLIAGDNYSVEIFLAELLSVMGFSCFTTIILFLCPGDKLTLGYPLWSGFCGGFAGGYIGGVLGELETITMSDVARLFCPLALIGMVLCGGAVLYAYLKALREERRGVK